MTKNYRGYSAEAFAQLEAGFTTDQLAYYAGIERAYLGHAITQVPDMIPASPQAGRDGQQHQGAHGYEGGTYGWNCICGEAGNDHPTDDEAALGLSEHLADVEILAEVA